MLPPLVVLFAYSDSEAAAAAGPPDSKVAAAVTVAAAAEEYDAVAAAEVREKFLQIFEAVRGSAHHLSQIC